MPSERYFSHKMVADALGVRSNLIKHWIDRELLQPVAVEFAGNSRYGYSVSEVLAVAVVRRMRAKKLPMRMIVGVCNFLRSKSISELEAERAAGRRYILTVGKNDPLLALLSHDAIFHNPAIDLKAAAAVGANVVAIDTQAAFVELMGKIEAKLIRQREERRERLAASPFAQGRRQRFLKERAKLEGQTK